MKFSPFTFRCASFSCNNHWLWFTAWCNTKHNFFLSLVYLLAASWKGGETQEGCHDWLAFHIIRVWLSLREKARSKYLFWCWNNAPFSFGPGHIPESSTLLESSLYVSNSRNWSLTAHMCSGSYCPMQWYRRYHCAVCLSLSTVYRGFHSLFEQFKKLISSSSVISNNNGEESTQNDNKWQEMIFKNGILAQWLQIANCNHNRQLGLEVGSQLRSPDEVDCDEKLMQTTFCQSPGKYV